jgi:uncharacterized delta-60 repeat protein
LLLERFRPNGWVDRSFGDEGAVTTNVTPLVDYGADGALRPNGDILALTRTFEVVRYGPSGDLEHVFRVDPPELEHSEATSLIVDRHGRLLLGGEVWDGASATDVIVARLTPGTGLDETFSRDGLAINEASELGSYCDPDRVMDLELQDDGKILAAGRACSAPNDIDLTVVRYREDGRRDNSFGGDGIVRTSLGGAEFANASALRFGKLVVGGSGAVGGGDYDFVLTRYRVG